MASENAKGVAREVLETIGKGEKPSVLKIAPKHGYSVKTAGSGEIQKTKTYREAMKPLIDRLVEERDRAIEAMKGKISKAKYRDLTDSVDKLTKNIQLLGGKATETVSVIGITYNVPGNNNNTQPDS